VFGHASGTVLTSSTPNPSVYGYPVSFTASVVSRDGTGGTPTGQVIFKNTGTGLPVGSATLSGGSYSLAAQFLPQGNYSLMAHYTGDSTFAPSDSAAISVTLSKQASQVVVRFITAAGNLTTGSQSVAYGSNYSLRVDVENASSGNPCQSLNNGPGSPGTVNFVCPSGTVSLFDGGQPLNDFPMAQNNNATNAARLNDRGFAEDQPIQLNVGSHSITATYAPDATSSYMAPASASNTLSVTITQATTTTTASSNTASIAPGGSVTLTAKVTTGSNSAQGPTGMVQFLNGGANLGSAATCTPTAANNSATPPVGASCTATLTTALSALPPGFLDPGPRNTPFVLFVTAASLAAALALLSFLLAARMAARRRQYAFAGAVFFLIAVAVLAGCGGGGSSSNNGSSRNITAKYSGDSNYASSTSAAVSITIQ